MNRPLPPICCFEREKQPFFLNPFMSMGMNMGHYTRPLCILNLKETVLTCTTHGRKNTVFPGLYQRKSARRKIRLCRIMVHTTPITKQTRTLTWGHSLLMAGNTMGTIVSPFMFGYPEPPGAACSTRCLSICCAVSGERWLFVAGVHFACVQDYMRSQWYGMECVPRSCHRSIHCQPRHFLPDNVLLTGWRSVGS